MNQNESAIEQINLGYNDQEDRLLLKIGLADKSEIAVWITRRICKLMTELLKGVVESEVANVQKVVISTMPDTKSQALDSFAREVADQEARQKMDFKSAYVTDCQAMSEQPLLAMQCVIDGAVSQPAQLELQCQNGQTVRMALTTEMVQALLSMVQLSTREAAWDLSLLTNSSQINLISDQQVLH